MPNLQRHDSGVETDSDESATMSVESPRLHHHQLDEGITDAQVGADLPSQEMKVLEIPRPQQMDTEAVEDNRPSTSRAMPVPDLLINHNHFIDQPSSAVTASVGGKISTRQNRTKFLRTYRIYPKKNPRKIVPDERALRDAAAANDLELCRRLIEDGANVHGEDSRKRTALHFAATHRGSRSLVEMLLEKGADPNVQDIAGNTPLHLAICINDSDVTLALLRHGGDITTPDKAGRNPLELAKSRVRVILETSRNTEVTDAVRMETLKVIRYIHQFLRQRRNASANIVRSFQDRISASTTSKEFSSDVSDLLASLQHLQL